MFKLPNRKKQVEIPSPPRINHIVIVSQFISKPQVVHLK